MREVTVTENRVLNIDEELRDLLKETEYAKARMDMLKLSQQTTEVQREVCDLLITGKATTFKSTSTSSTIWVERIKTRGERYSVQHQRKIWYTEEYYEVPEGR